VLRKTDVRKYTDLFLYSRYCAESHDRYSCCSKIKICMLATLYYLVKRGDWVPTKEIEAFTKLEKVVVSVSLGRLFRLGIVEKRYVPCYRGIMALWRVREDVLNGYDKKSVLELLMKHIRMCVEHSVVGVTQFSETA